MPPSPPLDPTASSEAIEFLENVAGKVKSNQSALLLCRLNIAQFKLAENGAYTFRFVVPGPLFPWCCRCCALCGVRTFACGLLALSVERHVAPVRMLAAVPSPTVHWRQRARVARAYCVARGCALCGGRLSMALQECAQLPHKLQSCTVHVFRCAAAFARGFLGLCSPVNANSVYGGYSKESSLYTGTM